MKFLSDYQNNALFQIFCKDNLIQEEINSEFLGLEVDKHMYWKTHIKLVPTKGSSTCYALRCMKHMGSRETFKMMYRAYFHTVVMYGAIFWGN